MADLLVYETKMDSVKNFNISNDVSEKLIAKSCFLLGGPINENRNVEVTIAGKIFRVLFDKNGKPTIERKA